MYWFCCFCFLTFCFLIVLIFHVQCLELLCHYVHFCFFIVFIWNCYCYIRVLQLFFRRKCVKRFYIIILITCCCRQSAHTINRNAKIASDYTIVLSDVLCTTCLHVLFLQGLAISISDFRTANFDLNLVRAFAFPSAWYKFERPLLEILK